MLCETVQQVNALKRSENIQRINDPSSNGLRFSVSVTTHHRRLRSRCPPPGHKTPYPSTSIRMYRIFLASPHFIRVYFFGRSLPLFYDCSTVAA